MTRVFVIGSLNVDLALSVDHIVRPGETQMIDTIDYRPGGKGLNQAVACARMGTETFMVGSVGDDHLADLLTDELTTENNLCLRHLNSVNDYMTGQAFVQVETAGENAILVASGANEATSAQSCASAFDEITRGDLVVFQLEIPIPAVKECAHKAKERGAFTILNAAPATADVSVLENIDLLVVNETEAAMLLGHEDDIYHYASRLYDKFGCDVIATLGAQGSVIRTADVEARIDPLRVDVVDTTGAGDAFVGALSHALASNQSLVEAVCFATALSSQVCMARGAQGYSVTPEYVEELATTVQHT
ncbi:MAG: ribokinase [Actinomycetaceae bacterium]|nr:ribokinase [Actinomycetaceae bacterium]